MEARQEEGKGEGEKKREGGKGGKEEEKCLRNFHKI